MGKTATNISIILGVLTVVFAGYYMYTQQSISFLSKKDPVVMQNMLNNTRVFISHGRALDAVTMDVVFFEDERFLSFKSYTTPIQERPIGRTDPFAPATVGGDGVSF